MLHTIYFKQNRLVIASAMPEELLQTKLPGSLKVYEQPGKKSVKEAISQVHEGAFTTVLLLHARPEQVLEEIKSYFIFIQAAGGIVQTGNHRILLIFRNGKWDLPKGKLDAGEELPACAVREVMEETGLKTVTISQPIGTTYHTYFQDGHHCLKESHWYLMHTTQTENLQPQLEEGIEQCIWADPAGLDFYLSNTHPSIADVLQQALPMLQ